MVKQHKFVPPGSECPYDVASSRAERRMWRCCHTFEQQMVMCVGRKLRQGHCQENSVALVR
jgi:hypothetical protein